MSQYMHDSSQWDEAEVSVLNPPENYSPGKLLSGVVVPGNIVVYGWTITSTNGAAQFVCMFDASAIPGTGAVPLFSTPVAAHNIVGFGFGPNGRRFKTGLALSNSSTDATLTAGSADCFWDVQYQRLSELVSEDYS